jgi:hypothetical protein
MRTPDLLGLDDTIPAISFLLGGYSWKVSGFRLWTIYYDPHIRAFTARRASRWQKSGPKWIHFVGDDLFFSKRDRLRARFLRLCRWRAALPERSYDGLLIDEAKGRLLRLLRARGKLQTGGFDMEPFEVLRDMVRSGKYPTLGGPPQLLKVYRHMNVQPFGVYWPRRGSGRVAVLGRPLIKDEAPDYPVLDPDTLEVDQGPWR